MSASPHPEQHSEGDQKQKQSNQEEENNTSEEDTANMKRKFPEVEEPSSKLLRERSNSNSQDSSSGKDVGLPKTEDDGIGEDNQGNSLPFAEEGYEILSSETDPFPGVPQPGPIQFTAVSTDYISLIWGCPEGRSGNPKFRVTCNGDTLGETDSCYYDYPSPSPGKRCDFTVTTLGEKNQESECVSATAYTAIPEPLGLEVNESDSSIVASWKTPEGLEKPTYLVSLCVDDSKRCLHTVKTTELKYRSPDVKLDMKYIVRVAVVMENGQQGNVVTKSFPTVVPPPEVPKVVSQNAASAEIEWTSPGELVNIPHSFRVKVNGTDRSTTSCYMKIPDLQPGTEYTAGVHTELNGHFSEALPIKIITVVPSPERPAVISATTTSAKIRWASPGGLQGLAPSFLLNIEGREIPSNSCDYHIQNLKPGSDYTVNICTVLKARKSQPVSVEIHTQVPPPENPKEVSVSETSAELKWTSPRELHNIEHSFVVKVNSGPGKPTTMSDMNISDLDPGTKYTISIYTKVNQCLSKPVQLKVQTAIPTKKFYTVVIGNTQMHHLSVKQKLVSQSVVEVNSLDAADFILGFCVIVSRVGTDMEAALKDIPDIKPAILVVMHHTFDPDYVIPDTSRFSKGRNITVVDVLFHEDKGILVSQKNREAEQKMLMVVRTQIPLSGRREVVKHNIPGPSNIGAGAVVTRPKEVPTHAASSISRRTGKVTFSTTLSGNTLGVHTSILQLIRDKTSLTEASSKEQCDFLLVFCPIVSSVKLDIERAYKQIPDSKAAILVVMHHTFDHDLVPHEGSGYPKRDNLLVVHCLFHEDQGFLKCTRNTEVIQSVIAWLRGNFSRCVVDTDQSASTTGSFKEKAMSWFGL